MWSVPPWSSIKDLAGDNPITCKGDERDRYGRLILHRIMILGSHNTRAGNMTMIASPVS